MLSWIITNDDTGEQYQVEGDTKPTPEEIEQIMESIEPGFMDKVKAFFSPPTDDLQELPYIYQGADESALEMYRQKDPSAQMGEDSYGNPTFTGDQGTYYPDKPGFTMRDIPEAQTDITRGLQVAAPSIAGGGVVSGMGAMGAMPVMGAIGAASEGVREGANAVVEGRPYDFMKPAVGFAADFFGEGGGRILSRILSRVLSKKGIRDLPDMVKPDGELTDDAVKLLERYHADGSLEKELAKMQRAGALTPEEAQRANLFFKHGMQPTKAQVTRKATDFQAQEEAYKRSGEVRTALEQQDVHIAQEMDELVPKAGGDAYEYVRNEVESLDKMIFDLYEDAKLAAPGDTSVGIDSLMRRIQELYGSDTSTGNRLIKGVRSRLKEMGLIPQKGARPKISVGDAEEVRKFINQLSQDANGYGKSVAKQLKDALDDDVFSAVGDDFFDTARSAKGNLEQSLTRTSAGRRDKRAAKGLLYDVVENRIGPDDFLPRLKGKSTRPQDVLDYKEWLLSRGPDGELAWNSLRRDVMDDIIDTMFKGPEGELGTAIPTRAKMERAMKAWENKLPALFSGDEIKFLDEIKQLMRYREPVTATAKGYGPSSQGMFKAATSSVDRLIRKLPLVGDLGLDILRALSTNVQELRMIRSTLDIGTEATAKGLTAAQIHTIREGLLRAFRPTGGVIGGAVIAGSE